MDILLAMAHTSIAELDAKAVGRDKAEAEAEARTGPQYYAMDPQQQWRGPFTLPELGALSWLSPLTWITAGEKQPVERAWKQQPISEIFAAKLREQPQAVSNFICPACGQPLVAEAYEGTQVYECRFCAGTLVEDGRIARILARTGRERPCSERIQALARATVQENQARASACTRSGRGRSPSRTRGTSGRSLRLSTSVSGTRNSRCFVGFRHDEPLAARGAK